MKIHIAIFGFCILLTRLCAVAQQEMASKDPSTPPPSAITGSGTKGHIPKFTGKSTIGNSLLFQNTAGNVGIGTTTPAAKLDVNGAVNAATSFNLGGSVFAFGSLAKANAFLGFSGNSTMTGRANTAGGYQALQLNTSGSFNTASGAQALYSNSTGQENTATGVSALLLNTTGEANTASGAFALESNATGNGNTADGQSALNSNTSGFGNTASGDFALSSNATGNYNTALGYSAGPDQNSTNLTNATAIGANAVVSESNALVLGGTGQNGVKVGIGTATPANVFTIAQGAGKAISDGWTTYSSRRWKANIQTLHGALGKIELLRGVSYDLEGKHEVGVIAEEVGTVVPEVVTWDQNGKDAQGVDYGRLTALLIEATKEQERLILDQEEQIMAQQAEIARLASQVRAIRASLKMDGLTDTPVRSVTARSLAIRQ